MKELDKAVHEILNGEPIKPGCEVPPYSTDWLISQEIVEKNIHRVFKNVDGTWTAESRSNVKVFGIYVYKYEIVSASGATILEAAMRCFVKFKLGDDHVNQSR